MKQIHTLSTAYKQNPQTFPKLIYVKVKHLSRTHWLYKICYTIIVRWSICPYI